MTAVEELPVVVIGGGHAGLSVSWHLVEANIPHVVLERDSVMHTWRDARWDSFTLVTPNWQCRLPGYHYDGDDPDGFMTRDQVNAWLAGYAASFEAPVRSQSPVTAVWPTPDGRFEVRTPDAHYVTDQVVVATGGYHHPAVPRIAERLPRAVTQLHSSGYRNPDQFGPGPVLVVGTGQSGAQIAEDLHLAGREVHLAVGSAPRFARRYRGRDVIAWLHDTGHYGKPVTDKPLEERTQDRTNHYVTGRGGGRDIDLRVFAQQGMTLHGHLSDVVDGRLVFADDLERNLDAADAVYNGINQLIDDWITARDIAAGEPSRYTPSWRPQPDGPSDLDPAELAGVVWATGFHRDYGWLHASVFDGAGHPQHVRGVTAVEGVYFVGLPWLHTWGSGRFAGIEVDAGFIAEEIMSRLDAPRALAAVPR